jgi:transcriptional regulator with XRE-family HTH domain
MIAKLGAKLRRTRESLGITQEELSRAVGLSSEFISLLEVGKRTPSLQSLRRLSAFLKKDMAYFLEEKEAAFDVFLNDKKMSSETRNEIRRFKRYCEDYLQLEDLTGRRLETSPLYLSGSPEVMAWEERERLGLGDEPIRDIFGLIEMNGLRLLKQNVLPKAQIAGIFVYFSAEQAGFALVSTAMTQGEQRLIAAHEYCHFLKDRMDGPILDNADIVFEDYLPLYHPREKFAHRFAVNFLVPSSKLRRIHQKELSTRSLHFEDVIYLKRYFGVNTSLMLRRLLELNLISSQRYYEFKEIDFFDFEKSLFGNVIGDALSMKGRGKTISSERYKTLGVSAFQKDKAAKV